MRTEYKERIQASGASDMPPWLYLTSAELAKVLGVHIQTLANWRLRGKGPPEAPRLWFKGRPARYHLGCVRVWAEAEAGNHAEFWRFNGEWLRDHMQFPDWQDKGAVYACVQKLMTLSKSFRPEALTKQGREDLMIASR